MTVSEKSEFCNNFIADIAIYGFNTAVMGMQLKLEGQLVGVFQNDQNGFFARFNFNNHEVEIPCDSHTFHKTPFGEAILTLEVNQS